MSDLEVVKDVYSAVASGDMEVLMGLLDPNIVVVEASSLPYAGTYEGHEGFSQLLARLWLSWDEFNCSEFEYFDGSDAVVVIFRFRALSRDTGKRIDMRIAEHWKVVNGKISFLEPFYYDTYHTCEVLGNARGFA